MDDADDLDTVNEFLDYVTGRDSEIIDLETFSREVVQAFGSVRAMVHVCKEIITDPKVGVMARANLMHKMLELATKGVQPRQQLQAFAGMTDEQVESYMQSAIRHFQLERKQKMAAHARAAKEQKEHNADHPGNAERPDA